MAYSNRSNYVYGRDEKQPAKTGEPSQLKSSGCCENVADTDRIGLREDSDKPGINFNRNYQAQGEKREAELRKIGRRSCTIPNTDGKRQQGKQQHSAHSPTGEEEPHGSACQRREAATDTYSQGFQICRYEPKHNQIQPENRAEFSDWWAVEPDVGRVANGVPNRVDRLKGLGNAVCPPQFYPFFRAIAEIERSVHNPK